jgi:hypothetical protein
MPLRPQLVAVASLLCISAAPSALANTNAQPFEVTSTLKGKTVLPHRMHWVTNPALPAKQVALVQFLIDGKVRWIERSAPYVYGGDDDGENRGYLITTWLTAGRHDFSVRVTATNGTKATETVTARVLPAPAPPAALEGTWKRLITPEEVKKCEQQHPRYGCPGSGTWKLVFDTIGVWEITEVGSGAVSQYAARPGTINVYAPIPMSPELNGHTGISRYGGHDIGGGDCTAAGPFANYRWSVSGDELTLTPTHETCDGRRAAWEGIWTRAH